MTRFGKKFALAAAVLRAHAPQRRLEQLRALEAGMRIDVVQPDRPTRKTYFCQISRRMSVIARGGTDTALDVHYGFSFR